MPPTTQFAAAPKLDSVETATTAILEEETIVTVCSGRLVSERGTGIYVVSLERCEERVHFGVFLW